MTTALVSPDALPRPNPFDDPTPFNRVRVAGLLITAIATKFNNIVIEDEWKKQKSKSTSGAVFSFGGTNPVGGEQGFSISFRVVTRDDFDQLYDVYLALAPVPVAGGGGGGGGTSTTPVTYAVGSPPKPADSSSAEQLLQQAQNALTNLNSPTPAPTSIAPAASQTAATTPQPSPGPRPPTVPIELGWLAFLGCIAVARKSFGFTQLEPDVIEVTIGFIHDSPPKPAGAGGMSPPKPAAVQYVQAKSPAQIAAAGAAGT